MTTSRTAPFSPGDVLDFWFGPRAGPDHGKSRPEWFRKDDAFDADLRRRFEPVHGAAHAGALDDWQAVPHSALALVIVLDQFSRNMYRGSPRAFASDAKVLGVARAAVDRGFDQALSATERSFLYLPFEHGEDLPTQNRSVELFERLREFPGMLQAIDYAYRHRAVIERFGRFPHRNAILGRPSTPEEIEFLKQPGSSF